MSDEAKRDILSRIAEALHRDGGAGAASAEGPVRNYRTTAGRMPKERLDLFVSRVSDYRAQVETVDADGVSEAVRRCLGRSGGGSYVVPASLPEALRPPLESVSYLVDKAFSARELAAFSGVVTGCALAVAETGTIVLDGGEGQGRRAITLVPDHMVCVVREGQIVDTVPEAMRAVGDRMRRGAAALTFVSGPSATSDIELRRVEGVHGPRRLDVVVVRGA